MSYRGDFDAAGYVTGDVSTWPGAPVDEYSPGDWWYVTGAGVVDGVDVDVGDRLYPIGVGRRWGERDYGDAVFGGPPDDPPWPPDPARVDWRVTSNSLPAWDRPAPPYAGCPLIGSWRIVVEVLTVDAEARTYGTGDYGTGTYGDQRGLGVGWVDVTDAAFGVVIRRGGTDASPFVDVDELNLDLRDLDAVLLPLVAPRVSSTIGVGTMIRVSVLDAESRAHPLFVGRIERVDDPHDHGPRLVSLDAFGVASDLSTTLTGYNAPAQTAAARIATLLDRSGWSWGPVETWPPETATLRAVDPVETVEARGMIELSAISARWQFDTDARGIPRVRSWPIVPTRPTPIDVADRAGTSTGYASPRIGVVGDTGETLNVATATSDEIDGSPAVTATAVDDPSIAVVGRRSQTLGFPLTALSARSEMLAEIVAAAVDRHGRIINRVESFDADTSLDDRWLAELVDLDTGTPVTVHRTRPVAATLDTVVVGFEHRIVPGRWTATVYTSTRTRTY